MKLFSKIRAILTLKGKQTEWDLVSAEVRQDGVLLRTTTDPSRQILVRSNEVDIMIKPGGEILEEDIQNYVEGVDRADQTTADVANTAREESCFDIAPASEDASFDMPTDGEDGQIDRESRRSPSDKKDSRTESPKPKKKSFTVMLYPDEHEKLMRLIKDNGYKKVEYILACVDSAKKTSMEANYKRLTEEHARRRKADAEEAKKAREEEQKTHEADDVK